MEQLREDLKELKADVKELIKQGVIHNELLRTHEQRSLELKARQDAGYLRLVPIEDHVKYINTLGKTLLGVASGVAIYAISRWLIG